MPLYDFKCPLGHTFEALAKPGEQAPCPSCGTGFDATGSPALEPVMADQQVSAARTNFQFADTKRGLAR
jgi:putative FmdB family regulatory protein